MVICDFLSHLVFSNKSTFHLSGKVNRHNIMHKPRGWRIHMQHEKDSPKGNIFCTMPEQKVYEPFFFIEKCSLLLHNYSFATFCSASFSGVLGFFGFRTFWLSHFDIFLQSFHFGGPFASVFFTSLGGFLSNQRAFFLVESFLALAFEAVEDSPSLKL